MFFLKCSNLFREYDRLSFIGTYSGTIVSAILLIFITEKYRDENTAVLRASQRPYLDILKKLNLKNNVIILPKYARNKNLYKYFFQRYFIIRR